MIAACKSTDDSSNEENDVRIPREANLPCVLGASEDLAQTLLKKRKRKKKTKRERELEAAKAAEAAADAVLAGTSALLESAATSEEDERAWINPQLEHRILVYLDPCRNNGEITISDCCQGVLTNFQYPVRSYLRFQPLHLLFQAKGGMAQHWAEVFAADARESLRRIQLCLLRDQGSVSLVCRLERSDAQQLACHLVITPLTPNIVRRGDGAAAGGGGGGPVSGCDAGEGPIMRRGAPKKKYGVITIRALSAVKNSARVVKQ